MVTLNHWHCNFGLFFLREAGGGEGGDFKTLNVTLNVKC